MLVECDLTQSSNNNDVDYVDTKVNDDFAILDKVDIGRDSVFATHRAQLLMFYVKTYVHSQSIKKIMDALI